MRRPILIVGAAGVFGSRLVEHLAATVDADLILAGRDRSRAEHMLTSLADRGRTARFEAFDRRKPDVERLRLWAPMVVIDAAGPFQGSGLELAEACIAAGVHYIDLADSRDFVARIPACDEAARLAGVAIISGASSTPALSHAVIDHLTSGWTEIASVLVAISPGNRAPRGLSVVRAILSYVGEPVRVFREGCDTSAAGWSLDETIDIVGVGRRHVALCETPDLDLLVSRYRPRVAAEFKAGLELGIMHHGMRMLGWLRSRGLAPRLAPFASFLRALADALQPFGTDRGGMLVRITGRDAADAPVQAEWSLCAAQGIGPDIPVLPALALVLRLARGEGPAPGAYAAAGVLGYDEILDHLNRLGVDIAMKVEHPAVENVFQRALGGAWDLLPAITRRIHRANPAIILEGEADVDGAETAMGRIIARVFGFPESGRAVPVRVVIESDGHTERWARHYPTRTMRSVMAAPDSQHSTVEERMGPFRFRLKLVGSAQGIDMMLERAYFHGTPLPMWLLPRIAATERASMDGRHKFDVRVSLPPFGRLVHYRGWLRPQEAT